MRSTTHKNEQGRTIPGRAVIAGIRNPLCAYLPRYPPVTAISSTVITSKPRKCQPLTPLRQGTASQRDLVLGKGLSAIRCYPPVHRIMLVHVRPACRAVHSHGPPQPTGSLRTTTGHGKWVRKRTGPLRSPPGTGRLRTGYRTALRPLARLRHASFRCQGSSGAPHYPCLLPQQPHSDAASAWLAHPGAGPPCFSP